MNVDKYCDVGLIFEVQYKMNNGSTGISKFLFPIDYTDEMVAEQLSNPPHSIDIVHISESGYALQIRNQFLPPKK